MKPNASPLFRYAERIPDERLAPWIACYWEFTALEGAPPAHNVPPDGCTSLVVPLGGQLDGQLLYTGPWIEPLSVPVAPGSRFVGVRLRPGAAETVLQVPVTRLLNATIPARAIGGVRGTELHDALGRCAKNGSNIDSAASAFDAYWLSAHTAFGAPDPIVSHAVDVIVASDGEMTIADVARTVACSERTLLRKFRTHTALSPKQFARIRRWLAAAWQAADGEQRWGRIAAAQGYADQPHLIHDMKALTGLRPEELAEQIAFTERDQVSRKLPG